MSSISYGPGGDTGFPTEEMMMGLVNGTVSEIYQCNENSAGLAAWTDSDALAVCFGAAYVRDFDDFLKGLPCFPPAPGEDYMVDGLTLELHMASQG